MQILKITKIIYKQLNKFYNLITWLIFLIIFLLVSLSLYIYASNFILYNTASLLQEVILSTEIIK